VTVMKDGTKAVMPAGTGFWIPPGHEGWVEGNQECLWLDATGCDASYGLRKQSEEYTKGILASPQGSLPLTTKNFNAPDMLKHMTNNSGEVRILTFGEGASIMKFIAKPGWKWSANVKPMAGTDYCEHSHVGAIVSGQQVIKQSTGGELHLDARGGPVMFECDPGHDSWIVGDQDVVLYDVTPMSRLYTQNPIKAAAAAVPTHADK